MAQHDKLMDILHELGLDECDNQLIGNLYWNQSVSVQVDDQLSEVLVMKVVR